MTDKELLELAAKAAGIKGEWSEHFGFRIPFPGHSSDQYGIPWNPLTDDGDALRLAVKLNLKIKIGNFGTDVGSSLCYQKDSEFPKNVKINPHKDDPYSATRRAIVRAAAKGG